MEPGWADGVAWRCCAWCRIESAPILELPSGELIMDSLKIAEYLERTYPDQPSLFFPGQTSPFDPASAEGKMAKAFLTLFLAGKSACNLSWRIPPCG